MTGIGGLPLFLLNSRGASFIAGFKGNVGWPDTLEGPGVPDTSIKLGGGPPTPAAGITSDGNTHHTQY